MKKDEYKAKLLDPRWQKKRLKILERDNWSCQCCFDGENTLHIHHRYYLPDTEPWEYPDESLMTLCAECHEEETGQKEIAKSQILFALHKNFLNGDISRIASGFREMSLLHSSEVVASALQFALADEDTQRDLIERYFKHIALNTPKDKMNG